MKDLSIDIECPNCHRKVEIKARDMVPGTSKNCPYCHATFKFTGDDERKVQKALDDFEKSLKKLSKTIEFKF